MKWYLAKIIFQIICGDGDHTPQFDEQLRLIQAYDEKQAFAQARQIGIAEQDDFLNIKHQLVQWKFINVAELYILDTAIDGAELYSRIHETENAEEYNKLTNKKAADIQSGETHRLLQLL